jgi:hypothetical protein
VYGRGGLRAIIRTGGRDFTSESCPLPPSFVSFDNGPAATVWASEETAGSRTTPFSKEVSKVCGVRLVVQVTRRATRFWIRYLLKTKNATAHDASRRTMTTAAITPPEG